jgi:hypothetical protein
VLKLHIFLMECVKSYNWFQTFCRTKTCPFYESTCALDELDKIPNHIQKIQNLKILMEWATRQTTSFLNHLKNKMLNGFKMSSFRCITCLKNNFAEKHKCPLKLILGFFGIFCIFNIKPKYVYTIMYECEKSPLTHELSYIGLFNFFHLSLFHVNVICKK